jgi:dihydropyrimidinase
MATNPARLAGLYPRKGTIAVGSDADFVIIDPEARVTLAHTMLHGKTDYTPFEGWELQGYPVMTIGRGKVLVRDGELVAQRGVGQFLERNRFEPF